MQNKFWIVIGALVLLVPLVAAQSATGMKFRGGATLTVTFLSQDPDPVEPGSYVDLRWKVENLGTQELQDVQFVLDVDYPFSLNTPADRVKVLGDVGTQQAGDDAIILHWRIRVDENALEGENEVRLSYFIEDAGVKLSPFPVNIKSSQALLAVESVLMDPAEPAPGDLVNVSITLHNIVDTSVEDVKVKLDLQGMPLATIGSTNERVLERISGGERAVIPFTLAVDANADAKVHQVPLRIEYQNRFGDLFALNTTYGLRIGAASDYLINLEETEVYTDGSKGSVTLSVSNIGKSDLNFVAVELQPTDEYQVVSAAQSYLGNLESDDFETAEFTLYVPSTKAKQVTLKGNLKFKDAYNANRIEPFALALPLYSNRQAKAMGLTKGGGLGWIVLLLILIAVLIVEWRRGWKEFHWLKNKIRRKPGIEPTHERHIERRRH